MLVLNNQWYARFYDALQNKDQAVFWKQIALLLLDRGRLHRDRDLQVLPDAAAAAALARLDDAQLPAALDGRPAPSTASSWRATAQQDGQSPDNPDQRIQEDMQLFTDYTMTLSMGLLNAVVTLVSFIGILWGLSGVRRLHAVAASTFAVPGSMVWIAAGLLRGRHRHHALHRPAADRAELPAAALRGRLPPPPGARARVQRGDRAGPRRAGRARPARAALRRAC